MKPEPAHRVKPTRPTCTDARKDTGLDAKQLIAEGGCFCLAHHGGARLSGTPLECLLLLQWTDDTFGSLL